MKRTICLSILIFTFFTNCIAQNTSNKIPDNVLYIVDGVDVTKTAIDSLNPKDIVEVSVFKGETAVILYGSKASEGAIVFITKKYAMEYIHKKLSLFSGAYSDKIRFIQNEEELLYVIDNQPIIDQLESKLYALKNKEITEITLIDADLTKKEFRIKKKEGAVLITTK